MTRCDKITYRDRQAAEDSAALSNSATYEAVRSKKVKRKNFHAYECPYCGMWHLTTQRR